MRFHYVWRLSFAWLIMICATDLSVTMAEEPTDYLRHAGPHVDGSSYAALRDGTQKTQEFSLAIQSPKGSQNQEIVLGPDFVVQEFDGTVIILDFLFRRYIQVELNSDEFSNNSLFGVWAVRYEFLQNNLRTTGIITSASDGDLEMARFWVEQSYGMNVPEERAFGQMPTPVVSMRTTGDTQTVEVEGRKVAVTTISPIKFESDDHAASFAAWLCWMQGFHPRTAKAIASTGRLPAIIERTTKRLGADSETKSTLEFSEVKASNGGAELLAGLNPTLPVWEPHISSSMAALMLSAANGQAPNGPASPEDYIEEMNAFWRQQKTLDAVLVALHASYLFDGCVVPEFQGTPLCNAAANIIRNGSKDCEVRALINAIDKDQAGKHKDAATALIKLRSDKLERPDILEIIIANALVEGMRKDQLDRKLKKEFSALSPRFEEAFQRDPYQPTRYRDFYNYLFVAATTLDDRYAVRGRAYPVIDIARALPERRVPAIVERQTNLEARIVGDFPALFPGGR